MFTRLTATVTISAPEASGACTMIVTGPAISNGSPFRMMRTIHTSVARPNRRPSGGIFLVIMITTSGVDRSALLETYRQTRARSAALFDLLGETAYYSQPIAL